MSLYSDPIDTHDHTVQDAVDLYGSAMATGAAAALVTSLAVDDIIDTAATHPLVAGDFVIFRALTGGAGLAVNTPYRVSATSLAATTFRVTAAAGGADLGFTTDITAGTFSKLAAPAVYTAPSGSIYLAQSAAEVLAQKG